MKNITISEEAYKEFKELLDENKIESYNIRINLAGYGCGGPAFNITVDDATDADVTETVNDITFVMEKSLIDEFGGFIFLSTSESANGILSLKPVIEQEGGCGSCGGGCH